MAIMFAMLMGVVARGIFRLTLGAQSRQSLYQERARQAALSGLEYVRTQLALDSDWKGNSTLGTTINTDSLLVKESNGNILGLLTYPDGTKGQFRIRFNYQDGPGGGDGMDDPPSSAWISSDLLSINNLDPGDGAKIPSMLSNFGADPDISKSKEEIPSHSAYIRVEGRAGTGVDKLTSTTLNDEPSGYVDTVEIDSILKVTVDEPVAPSVLQGAGELTVTTVDGINIGSLDDTEPSIRSKQSVTVKTPDNQDGLLQMPDGHVWAANSELNADYDEQSITLHDEQASSDLSSLTWEQVSKPNGNASFKLPAGTYVLWPPLSTEDPSSNGKLHYYNMNYQTYLSTVHQPYIMNGQLPPTSLQGQILSNDMSEVKMGAGAMPDGVGIFKSEVIIKQDLIVVPTQQSQDFALIPLVHGAMTSTEMSGVKDVKDVDGTVAADSPGGVVAVDPGDGGVKDTGGGKDTGDGKGGGSTGNAKSNDLQLRIVNSKIHLMKSNPEAPGGDMIFKGGSISAEGATLIGEGDLQFNTPSLSVKAGETNISLYFKGDIALSSYDRTNLRYGKFDLSGIIYSWGDVTINLGDANQSLDTWGAWNFIGSMIAYGGDPTSGVPGNNDKGAISLSSKSANIMYDPTTLAQISSPQELDQALIITSVGSWIRL